jgi:hypothetical protein
MNRDFRFSIAVTAWLLVLAIATIALGLAYPKFSIVLGGIGLVTTFATLFKASFRTGRWFWWQIAGMTFTPAEGLVGASGVALFSATILVVILYFVYHAA